jgi:hypothetical protein
VGIPKPALAIAERVSFCPQEQDRPTLSNDKTGPVFDIQIVRRGISSEVLKRKSSMSKNRKISFTEIDNRKKPKKHRPKPRRDTSPIKFRFYHPALWALDKKRND